MSLEASDAVLQSASGLMRLLQLAGIRDCWERRWQYLLCQASLMQTCRAARDLVTFGADMRTMFFRHCVFFILCNIVLEEYHPGLPLCSTDHLKLVVPLPSGKLELQLRLLLPVSSAFAQAMRATKLDHSCILEFLGFVSRLKCDTLSRDPRNRPLVLLPGNNKVHCRLDTSKAARPMFRIIHGPKYKGYLCAHCLADVLLRVGDVSQPN